MVKKPNLLWLLPAATFGFLQACDGGGSESGGEVESADYLVASTPEFYFGTRNVGTRATQKIELSNRSGDIYPIKGLELVGANAEEFSSDIIGELTLKPAEKISLDVSFIPITDGQKVASLKIDYDIIQQVSPEANRNEQKYYAAQDLEQEGEFEQSRDTYQKYLQGGAVTSNKNRAAIKLPVLNESENHGSGADFEMYLAAVNNRDSNEHDKALENIDKLLAQQPDSTYADDALYMRGYIQLMDKSDFRGARETMSQLRQNYPDTKYYDTALFSEALATDEMGERPEAAVLYESLKERHTSQAAKTLSLDLPKDNYLSRLWFDRAKQGLARTTEYSS